MQVIVVIGQKNSMYATLLMYQRSEEMNWELAGEMDSVIGRNGLTDDKKEGDGKTPTGHYRIGTAFGTLGIIPCEWPFRFTGPNDYWVDDPASPDYNRWVVCAGNPDERWTSYERLAIPEYKQALVIRYNENPVIAGKGSAIFLHRWSGPGRPSAGCITVSEENVKRVIQWLVPDKNPVIRIKEESDSHLIPGELVR